MPEDWVQLAPRNLATPEFWADTYLSAYSLPSRPSAQEPWERCLMRAFEAAAPAAAGERVVELGCAPGRWMVFYAERFGAAVEGIEYTEYGVQQTRENLWLCGVEGTVHHADFWEFQPLEPYDLVVSLGFIEHFADIDRAFERHIQLLRPGGRLLLQLPNFQGVNRVLQRWFDPEWLALHNMRAMRHQGYFKRAKRLGLGVEVVQYVGGFDPDVISVRKRGRRILAPFWHMRHRGYGDQLNAPWLSSSLMMVFRRPS